MRIVKGGLGKLPAYYQRLLGDKKEPGQPLKVAGSLVTVRSSRCNERNQRVNSSVELLLLVLIEWSGGEGYGGDRSRVCEGCRRQLPLNLPQSYRSLITPSLAVGILL